MISESRGSHAIALSSAGFQEVITNRNTSIG